MKEGVVHLPDLLIGAPVVCPGLGGVFHPLMTMLALMMVTLSMLCFKESNIQERSYNCRWYRTI